jgi:hypothetical protein
MGPIVLHGTSHWISNPENYSEPHTGLWARMGGGDKLQSEWLGHANISNQSGRAGTRCFYV